MKKYKVIEPFKDLKHDVLREVGEEFNETVERAKELMVFNLVEEVSEAPKKQKKDRE